MAVAEERGVPIPIHQPSLLVSLLGTRGCRLVNVLNSVLQGHLPVCWHLSTLHFGGQAWPGKAAGY